MPAWVIFDKFHFGVLSGAFTLDWSADTIKMALVKSAANPDEAVHDFWNDLNTHEVSGTGYTAGGQTLTGKTENLVSGVGRFGASDPTGYTQNAGGFADARYAVLYKDTGTASTSPLICFADLGGNVGNVSGALTFNFDTTNDLIFETT